MNGLDHRMRKIEEKANSAKGGRILFCWTEPGEDLAEAGEKWELKTLARRTRSLSLLDGPMKAPCRLSIHSLSRNIELQRLTGKLSAFTPSWKRRVFQGSK